MSRTRLLVSAIHALPLAAAGISLVEPSLFESFPFALRLVLGLLVVFVLPGRFLIGLLFSPAEVDRWERLPLSLAGSLCLLGALVILSMELHGNAGVASWVLLTVDAVLLLAWHRVRRREPPPAAPVPRTSGLATLSLLLLLVLVPLLYLVGGLQNPPNDLAVLEEEALQIATVRKLAENEALSPSNVMHKAGVPSTYLYPPYHFGLALASRFARVDPIAVFIRFRPLAGLGSLLTLFAICLHVLPRRWMAELSLLVLVAAALSNMGGQVGGMSWGQLIPVTHWVDFGLGIEFPLLVLMAVRVVAGPWARGFLLLAPWFVLTSLLIHTREVLILLFFLLATAATMVVLRQGDSRKLRRVALSIAAILAIGLLYRERQTGLVAHAVQFESSIRQGVWSHLMSLMEKPILEVLSTPLEAYRFLYRSVFVLPFIATPFLLLSRRWFFRSFLWSGFVATILVLRVPYLRDLFVALTYSEMVFVPSRYFFPWMYLLAGLVFCFGLALADSSATALTGGVRLSLAEADGRTRRLEFPGVGPTRLSLALGLFVALVFGIAAVAAFEGFRRLAFAHLDLFLAWCLAGSLVVYLVPKRPANGESRFRFLDRELARPAFAAFWTVGLLVPLYLASDQKTLWQEYRAAPAQFRDLAHWREWYEGSKLSSILPWSHVRFLRDEIPPGRVVAFDYDKALIIPLMTNHYVPYVARPLSTELDFGDLWLRVTGKTMSFPDDPEKALRARLGLSLGIMRERRPLFDPLEAPGETRAFLQALGVEYVVADSKERARFEALNQLEPGLVTTRFEGDGLAIFEIRP